MNSEERSNNDPDDRSWIGKITQLFHTTPKTRQDISAILKIARDSNLLDDDEFAAIEGAMEVNDIQVREVMVPRNQMVVVSINQVPEEFLPRIIESGHSRFPVVGESNDDVIGILHAKDLLPLILEKDQQRFDISDYLRPVHKVPESKRLNKLMKEFREMRNHMAIVFNEYGGVAGLITIEDVLEEIVGEIEDEFDVEDDSQVKQLSDNDYIVKAQTTIEDFNSAFNVELDDSDFDTIGGLVTQQLGHVPQRNETVDLEQFTFKVLHSDDRRVHLLRLQIHDS